MRGVVWRGHGRDQKGVQQVDSCLASKWAETRSRIMSAPSQLVVAVFDTKPYDREYLGKALVHQRIGSAVSGIPAGAGDRQRRGRRGCRVHLCERQCAYRPVLEQLAKLGVRMIALRCAGFNNVDLQRRGRNLGIAVHARPKLFSARGCRAYDCVDHDAESQDAPGICPRARIEFLLERPELIRSLWEDGGHRRDGENRTDRLPIF